MGLFSKSSKLKFYEIPSTPEQTAARNWLQELYQRDMNVPLQGTAGLTSSQQDIQGQLGQFVQQFGGDYDAAASYLRNVMAGGYDPRTSDFYQGFRQEADMMRSAAQRDVARQAQSAGMARSTPSMGVQGLVGANYDSKILQALGGLYETERDRQTQAAGALPALRSNQVNTMAEANQLGEQARQVEQQQLDAIYNQALQTLLAPYTYQASIASALLNEQRYVGAQTGGGMTDLGFMMNAASGMFNAR